LLVWLLRRRCCGGGRWWCRGSQTVAPRSGETRLFTPLGISFCFLFSCCQASSLSTLTVYFSLKFPSLFQASPCSFLPFSLPSPSFFFFSCFSSSSLLSLRVVFIGQRGAGASLSPPYRCAWGAGPSCSATAPDEVANGCGLQGTASLVSHHEGACGFGFWQSTRGERGRQEEVKKKKPKLYLPLLHVEGKEEKQCRSKQRCFVPFFLT